MTGDEDEFIQVWADDLRTREQAVPLDDAGAQEKLAGEWDQFAAEMTKRK